MNLKPIELDKEELLTQKTKKLLAKRKLTAQNGENEKRKWTKIFERKNVDDENEPILTMDEVDASSRSNNAIRYNPDLNEGLNDTQVNERILI